MTLHCSRTIALFKWHALSKETRRVYGSAVRSYEEFCGRQMVARPWYPARTEIVQEWLAWMGSDKPRGRRLDHGTVNKYRFALRSYHVDLDLS